jgi:hypothetical protein
MTFTAKLPGQYLAPFPEFPAKGRFAVANS